jgi:hypothetical protein
MPQLTIEISANVVAWYAAVVATAALIMNVLVTWRDRASIVVTGMSGYKVTPGGPYDPSKDYLLITVSNLGRRPRTISKVGLRLKKGATKSHILAMDSAIKGLQELTEGRSDTWLIEYGGKSNLLLDSIKDVWACDQTGKMYRGKFQRLDKL